ncbi:amine oxidase [Cladophialophora carrionii]|uniref:Amine oxidase n=1 Tax=Cladophialophora carrionii TaxID=86049 RepID=A0A1C1CCG3_9EURO|nr:amine oxidase [Cladophialophora carrionii]
MAPRDDRPEIKFHDAPGMPDPGFYSRSVSLNQANRLIFTSGIIAQRPDGSIPEALEEQAAAVYKNLGEVLQKSGSSPRDAIKVTFFVVDWSLTQAQAFVKLFLDFITDGSDKPNRPVTTLVPVTQLAIPGAKVEVEVVAAVGGHASAYPAPSVRSFDRPVDPLKVDVVVVGGGFSGLQAAWDLQKAGLSCVLLEAKHRIGGRSRSQQLQSGPGIVELGATWINEKTQPKVFATAKRLGLDMVKQYTEGDEVWQFPDGQVLRASPGSPEFDQIAEFNMALCEVVDAGCKDIDIHKSGEFPSNLDVSFETWAASRGLSDTLGKSAMTFFTSAVVGRDSSEIGMHYFLDYVKSGGGFMSLATEGEYGAQSLKIKQGTSAIATGLADEMKPGSIFVDSPVDNIVQTAEGALVSTATGTQISCRKVIIAIPTNTYEKIHFSPPLPHDKSALVSRTKPGVYAKMILTYGRAWWRELGLVGKFSSLKGPICFSWDNSDETRQQYSLALFIAGGIAARWAELNELQRVEAVIDHLAELLGPEHGHLAQDDVLEVNYVNWSEEEFLGGAPTSAMPPGVLSKYGSALRQPFKHIHFAGGETAYEWKGYLEGALRAGSRAAEEVFEWAKQEDLLTKASPKL